MPDRVILVLHMTAKVSSRRVLTVSFAVNLFDVVSNLVVAVLPGSTVRQLRRATRAIPGVEAVNHLAAIYSGTSEVLVDVDLDLAEELDTTRIEALLDQLEDRVRTVVPDTKHVSINLNPPPLHERRFRASRPSARNTTGNR